MKSRRGLILSGPPGTGKTLVGKVLADTLGVTFLWVLPRHVGSPDNIAEILNAARFLSPVVVLFEDLDLFGEDRHAGQSSILGELMNQLDGVSENDGIVTIATTNRLEVVESALRNRPGRFDRVIELGLPDMKARRKLLQRLLAAITESDLTQLVAATDGYSPAQLEEVVNTMRLLAAESGDQINGAGLVKITPELINRTVREIGGQRKHGIGFSAKEAVERP
jgi:cell division protease FtsH